MTQCAFEGFFFGDQHTKTCLQKASNLTSHCAECWVGNAICNKKFCQRVCLHHKVLTFLPTFREWDDTLDPCIICDERFCGPEFVKCSGANRRRVGVVSDLRRDMNLEMCNVTDWDYINGDEDEVVDMTCAADAEVESMTTNRGTVDPCDPSNTTILDTDELFAELFPSSQEEIVKSITIPPDTAKVYLQFDLEEQCDWGLNKNGATDQFYILIGGKYLDPGLFHEDVQEFADNKFDLGYYHNIVGIIQSYNETMNTFLFDIPKDEYDNDNQLVWGIRLSDETQGCLAVSNVKVWSACPSAECTEKDEWHIEAGDWKKWEGETNAELVTSNESCDGAFDVVGPFGSSNGSISHSLATPDPRPEHLQMALRVALTDFSSPISFDIEIASDEVLSRLPMVLGGYPVGVSTGGVTAHSREAILDNPTTCKVHDVIVSIPPTVNLGGSLNTSLIYFEESGEFSVVSYAFSTKCSHSTLPSTFQLK
eukprot:CAMPEP_0168722632 /NCGR_PEP_ID=MMETSP0724-20121128/2698_1 /TAXON_ID=265536 /ORGANISM="Amphiprora sp., Strain CCMP467" /LENGTH=480 /DNA_ID=CAMNT_0008769311 /DNA_START=182 /DNA_END=1624 /DNA_ORIENTATION=-